MKINLTYTPEILNIYILIFVFLEKVCKKKSFHIELKIYWKKNVDITTFGFDYFLLSFPIQLQFI